MLFKQISPATFVNVMLVKKFRITGDISKNEYILSAEYIDGTTDVLLAGTNKECRDKLYELSEFRATVSDIII